MEDTKVSFARKSSLNKLIVLLSLASGTTMQSKSLERTTSKFSYEENFQDNKTFIPAIPFCLVFGSDDPLNNILRGPDGKAWYTVSTSPSTPNCTVICGRRDAPATGTGNPYECDRRIAEIDKRRWVRDKVSFGDGPATDIVKLFKWGIISAGSEEIETATFKDEHVREFEWRGADTFRAHQLFTTHEDPILIASFRYPKDGRPHLLLERGWDSYANLDMIVVTFLLLDRDRKRGKR